MTTSSLYVYLQRPDTHEWITLGRYSLDRESSNGEFIYAPSYLEAGHAWCVDPINLAPMDERRYLATRYRGMTDILRDISPDAWGKMLLRREHNLPEGAHEFDYLLKAGNADRWGALAVGTSRKPDIAAVARPKLDRLKDLLEELELISKQMPAKYPGIRKRLLQTQSMGGARPKATVQDGETVWLVKPTLPTDSHDVALAEYATMQWAERSGIRTARTALYQDGVRSAVRVARFDRTGTQRHMVISAATLLQTEYPSSGGRDQTLWSYPLLSQALRRIGAPPEDQLELFRRMIFNALSGNDDDHPRNHAVVWDEINRRWRLSPAFDVVPNIDFQPTRLSMQLSADRYDVCRESALADWRHFGFNSREAAETAQDEAVETIAQSFSDSAGKIASPHLSTTMHAHMKHMQKLLAR